MGVQKEAKSKRKAIDSDDEGVGLKSEITVLSDSNKLVAENK